MSTVGCFPSKQVYSTCRLMTAAISLLIGYENVEQEDDSDASSEDDVYKVIWMFLHIGAVLIVF